MEMMMANDYNDREAAAHYDDPAKRSIAGKKPRRRTAQGLSAHVPVRIDPETLESIRRLAAADGTTVSGWIRRVCEREIERRLPPATDVTYSGRFSLVKPEPKTTDTTHLEDTFERTA